CTRADPLGTSFTGGVPSIPCAFDRQRIFEALLDLDFVEGRALVVAEGIPPDASEAGVLKLLREPFVVPHPQMVRAADVLSQHADDSLRARIPAEVGVAHEVGGCGWSSIREIAGHALLEIREDQPEGAAALEIVERVPQSHAQIVKRQVLQDVAAKDRVAGGRRQRQPGNDVTVVNLGWKSWRQRPLEQRADYWKALQAKGRTTIAIVPARARAHAAAIVKVHAGCLCPLTMRRRIA